MTEGLFSRLGLRDNNSGVCGAGWVERPAGPELVSVNPATGQPIARVATASTGITTGSSTTPAGRSRPGGRSPRRARRGRPPDRPGPARARRPTWACSSPSRPGKIRAEGEGEVQEMIDMCDFAVGLSRQLYGLTIASERPRHRMIEQWHPLGPIGIITAFNFPVAVWAWNAMVAAVCGDTMVWKPSPETPLTAVAVQNIVNEVAARNGCPGVFNLCVGGAEDIGERMLDDRRLAADLGDRELPDGRAGRRGRRQAAGPVAPRAGRQQRDDRHAERRPRAGAPRRRLRRRRHRRPALHDAPPADRPRVDRSTPSSTGWSPAYREPADRRPVGGRRADRPADQRARPSRR